MTTNSEPDNGTSRDDLLQRIELMEAMIAEGRQTTMRCGWIFVLWGLVDLAGMGWQMIPNHSRLVWPVCLGTGVVLQVIGLVLRKRDNPRCKGMKSRNVEAVWLMMFLALIVYVGTAQATHFAWQYSYIAALLIIVGLAHAISAAILRWRVQAVVAAIWWVGAVAIFVCNSRRATNEIFLIEMCFGMIAFGLYVMFLEGRSTIGLKGACA
jgi:hypothetical protein